MYQLTVAEFETPVAVLTAVAVRGEYDEIRRIDFADGTSLPAAAILVKFEAALPETFVSFDKKSRGDALNVDLYAYDQAQEVAVVQIRHFFRRYKNGFGNVHKDYVLVGRNEITHDFFRHPVSAHAVRAGIRKGGTDAAAGVYAAQRWMWGVTDAQLDAGIRQGDILMVPLKSRPRGATTVDEKVVVVGGTHEVHAAAFAQDEKGVVYAEGPTIRHTKGQHLPTYGDHDGWHAIKVAAEASTWAWGERLGD